jgi:rare lipoprotein A (peptidoglycan hydrolase)
LHIYYYGGRLTSKEVVGEVDAKDRMHTGSRQVGVASWYGDAYAGRKTASGEIFDPSALTAAHPKFFDLELPVYAIGLTYDGIGEVLVEILK